MTQQLIKDALLVEVTYEENEKVILSFLDEEEGLLYEINWNFKKYDPEATGQNKWFKSEEQEAQVAKWADEVFGVPVEELKDLGDKGVKKDVYHYGTFNSLWEVERIAKYDIERKGEIFTVTIEKIEMNPKGIQVMYQDEGETYAVNFSTSKYMESMKKYVKDPVKVAKAKERFKETFIVPFEHKDLLIGQEIMVEIKVAGGKYSYVEAKKITNKAKIAELEELVKQASK